MNKFTILKLAFGALALLTIGGCERESDEDASNIPISRFEAEKMLSTWNFERKTTLKSASALVITEGMWRKSKSLQILEAQLSMLSVPLNRQLKISFTKKGSQEKVYFFETIPDSAYVKQNKGVVKSSNFSGFIIQYGSDGKGQIAYEYQNGKFAGYYDVISKSSKLKDFHVDINEPAVVTGTRKSRFFIEPGDPIIPDCSDRNEMLDQICSDETGGSGDINMEDPNIIIEEKFDESPCVEQAWEKLKSTGKITEVLENFTGEKPVMHLSLSVDNLEGANGRTSVPDDGYWINITIDKEYGSRATSISIARTFVHELIHAEMFRKIASVNSDEELKNSFPGIWDYYVRYKLGDQGVGNDYQHNALAQHYRDQIVNALKAFDKLGGIQRDDAFYQKMAWAGLYGTTPWNNLSKEEKEEILRVIKEQETQGGCENGK